jgi:hypothetical protein
MSDSSASWVRSDSLVTKSAELMAAIAALDARSAEDLVHDLSHDKFRFFNLVRPSRTWYSGVWCAEPGLARAHFLGDWFLI